METDVEYAKADSLTAIAARSYATELRDLDIDFAMDQRPVLITQLLVSCLQDADGKHYSEQTVWDWSLTRRLQALLEMVMATCGRRMRSKFRCSHSACNEQMELELDLTSFRKELDADIFQFRPARDIDVLVRVPTGSDQRRWLDEEFEDSQQATAKMAATLIMRIDGNVPAQDWSVPREWLGPLVNALQDNDPYTALQLDAQCPSCSETTLLDLDLEAQLLRVLADTQNRVLQQIHQIASAYHWSESETMAMPARRREYYVNRIHEGWSP